MDSLNQGISEHGHCLFSDGNEWNEQKENKSNADYFVRLFIIKKLGQNIEENNKNGMPNSLLDSNLRLT